MALGVKYRLDYSDEQLISWRADILQEGFTGSVTAVKMGGTPVTIEMRDIDDPFTPVCHTEATLTLVSESLGQYDEFKTADVYEYALQLMRDDTIVKTIYAVGDGSPEAIFGVVAHGYEVGDIIDITGTTNYNGYHTVTAINGVDVFEATIAYVANDAGYVQEQIRYWQGTLLTEPFTEAFESAPYDVELKFSDGLSELSYERYNVSGSLQAGFTTVIDILVKCLNKLPITRGFREIINLFEDNMDDADTEGLLEQLVIYEPAFWEVDKSDNVIKGEPCLKVIEGIMYSLKCRIVVSQDTYYIMRIAEAKTAGAVKYVDYDSTGTVTGNGTIDLRKSTSARTEVLPALLAHLSGATIDINKQYQEVEFSYVSKNITTMNNSLLINPNFDGGYELQNGSPVPLYWKRSTALNTLLNTYPTQLHLDQVLLPGGPSLIPSIVFPVINNVLVMEAGLLSVTRITSSPAPLTQGVAEGFLPTPTGAAAARESYNLYPFSPADDTITYKSLFHAEDDRIEIRIKGYFDYTYILQVEKIYDDIGDWTGYYEDQIYDLPIIFCKWKVRLGGKYYNTGTTNWTTSTDARAWRPIWAEADDKVIESYSPGEGYIDFGGGPKTRRHYFDNTIIIEALPTDAEVDDFSIVWFIPENYYSSASISSTRILFSSMDVNYVSQNSTEFSIQKVLGETESSSLRNRRYKSEVKHGDGPSNFSINSFRLSTNLKTYIWSSRGGSESLTGYKWDITQIFENLGNYRIIFSGKLYGLLEMHNIIILAQESKTMLIKGLRFDTKHNVYELKLHEVGTYIGPPSRFTEQFSLWPGIAPDVTLDNAANDPIGATSAGASTHAQTTEEANTEAQSYTQSTHVQTNNDTSESGGDYPG